MYQPLQCVLIYVIHIFIDIIWIYAIKNSKSNTWRIVLNQYHYFRKRSKIPIFPNYQHLTAVIEIVQFCWNDRYMNSHLHNQLVYRYHGNTNLDYQTRSRYCNYNQTYICGHLYYEVISIKRLPSSCPFIDKFI